MLTRDLAHEGIVLAQHMKNLELTKDVNPTKKRVNPHQRIQPIEDLSDRLSVMGWMGEKLTNILGNLEGILSY